MQPGDADVVEAAGIEAVGAQRQRALVGDRAIGGSGGDDQDVGRPRRRRLAVQQRGAPHRRRAVLGLDRLDLVVDGACQQHGSRPVGQQLADDAGALLR